MMKAFIAPSLRRRFVPHFTDISPTNVIGSQLVSTTRNSYACGRVCEARSFFNGATSEYSPTYVGILVNASECIL